MKAIFPLLLLVTAVSEPAMAQESELGLSIGAALEGQGSGHARDTGPHLGVYGMFPQTRHFSWRVDLSWGRLNGEDADQSAPGHDEGNLNVYSLTGSGQLSIGKGPVQPHLVLGLGPSLVTLPVGRARTLHIAASAGLNWELSDQLGLRLEYRKKGFFTDFGSEQETPLTFSPISIGISRRCC